MLTASVAVMALGFVVAVASRTLPGGSGAEPLLDLEFRPSLDLSPVFAWILVILAVLGAVLFAYGLKQSKPRDLGRRRSLLGTVVGLGLFVVPFSLVGVVLFVIVTFGVGLIGNVFRHAPAR